MNYSPDMTVAALKMLGSLALVLAVLWALHRWARRRLPNGAVGDNGRLVKVLASHHLGVKKAIMVVQVPGSVLVLGVGSEQVNLLSRIDDPAAVATLVRSEAEKGTLGFRDQLDRITRSLRGKPNAVAASEQKGTVC